MPESELSERLDVREGLRARVRDAFRILDSGMYEGRLNQPGVREIRAAGEVLKAAALAESGRQASPGESKAPAPAAKAKASIPDVPSEADLLGVVVAAAKEDWTAAAWLLTVYDPERYGPAAGIVWGDL